MKNIWNKITEYFKSKWQKFIDWVFDGFYK